MNERYLNFNKFIEQRAIQISKFSSILQIDTNKRTHQALPKSIRRRAMSHNRFRIPLKMRRPMQQDLAKFQSMQKVPKCRKNIRKKHRLLLSYKMRSDKVKWLNTHLWAVKRMRMCEYSNYKIAETPNDKGFRSAYRNFRNNACLIDYSYLQCLTITMIKNESQNFRIPNIFKLKYGNQKMLFDSFYEADIYQTQKLGGNLICPTFIFPQNNKTFRCLFDPFCLDEINKIQWKQMEGIESVEICKNKSQIYLILGPQSLTRFKQGLQKLGFGQKMSNIDISLGPIQNKIHYIFESQTENVKETKLPMISEPIKEKIVETYDIEENKRLRQTFFKSLIHQKLRVHQTHLDQNIHESNEIDHKKNNTKFWNFYDQLSKNLTQNMDKCVNYIQKITSRSKYTHKKKNKLTKQEKRKILIQDQQKDKQTSKQQQQQVKQIQQLNQKVQPQQEIFIQELQSQKISHTLDPILFATLINRKSNENMMQGCFVFCSNRDNCRLWRALSHTDIKVLGRKQLKHCYFQAGLRFFPDDYPESVSFQEFNKKRAIKLIDRHQRLPPQKRANYQKIISPSPFFFHMFQNNQQIHNVKIEMVSRGRCFTGSYICMIKAEDYEFINKSIENNGLVKHVAEQPKLIQTTGTTNSVDFKTHSYQQITQTLITLSSKMQRQIIGFITSGGFILSEGREGGIGYINQNDKTMDYILVRKPTSRYYYLGTIKNL